MNSGMPFHLVSQTDKSLPKILCKLYQSKNCENRDRDVDISTRTKDKERTAKYYRLNDRTPRFGRKNQVGRPEESFPTVTTVVMKLLSPQ